MLTLNHTKLSLGPHLAVKQQAALTPKAASNMAPGGPCAQPGLGSAGLDGGHWVIPPRLF